MRKYPLFPRQLIRKYVKLLTKDQNLYHLQKIIQQPLTFVRWARREMHRREMHRREERNFLYPLSSFLSMEFCPPYKINNFKYDYMEKKSCVHCVICLVC